MVKMIKKLSLMMAFVIILVFSTACTQSIQLIGTDQYFVQIDGDGEKYNESGYDRYAYELVGVDADGNEKTLEFTADHNLKDKAFLKVYYKDSKGVVSYEEVQTDELPVSAQDFFGINQ